MIENSQAGRHVPSCNACKIFFRRLITRTTPVKKCYLGENCFTKTPITQKCVFCRFQKCIQVGMTLPSYLHFGEQTKEKCLDSTIQNLMLLDAHREDLMANYHTSYLDPTIDEVIRINKVDYIRKSQSHQLNFYNWAFHCSLVTVDFMKKFPFVNLLRFEDQKYLLKEFYIKLIVFISSKRSMSRGKECMTFPDGSDVLPPASSEWHISKISPNLENKIRCRLIGRLSELRITDEEYLLMCVLIFCNPSLSQLSENGRRLLTSYQHLYSSALLQYCLLTYEKAGPARFAELLGICHVIGVQYDDAIHYNVLVQLTKARLDVKQLIKDGMDAAFCN
nr:hypothetical protein ZK6.4 - Caenorhabditis elegans [Caenorhabditis elegans]